MNICEYFLITLFKKRFFSAHENENLFANLAGDVFKISLAFADDLTIPKTSIAIKEMFNE